MNGEWSLVGKEHCRVEAHGRLHFGLLEICDQAPHLFGGIGLMLAAPIAVLEARVTDASIEDLHIESDPHWKDRIRTVCNNWLNRHQSITLPISKLRLYAPLPHQGLGSGTQIASMIAFLLWHVSGSNIGHSHAADNAAVAIPTSENPTLSQLAALSLRGLRSHIGLAGFLEGGFVVDLGQSASELPRTKTTPFPDTWPILLLRNPSSVGTHGSQEKKWFEECSRTPNAHRLRMMQLVEDVIVPSVRNEDWEAFDHAIGEYGRLAGSVFSKAQGGMFRTSQMEQLAAFGDSLGFQGVVQTSWGPTVALITKDEEQVNWLIEKYQSRWPELTLGKTYACNAPASFQWLGA
jgi:beta-ribofuranosylaminobenzene 5'-phosphate synthase